MDNETCIVYLPSGPTEFRSTVVKPYYEDDNDPKHDSDDNETAPGEDVEETIPNTTPPSASIAANC